MRQLIKKYWKFSSSLFVFLLGLTPLVWFWRRGNVLISGSDTNFPLNPGIWFLRRFFVWQSVSNGGGNFSSSTAGTFFHFLQFIPFKLGLPLQAVEISNLIFWFMFICLSAFLLARTIFPNKKLAQVIFVLLYSLNIYLFNTWENIKVANIALVAGIPLGLTILILLQQGKIKRSLACIFSIGIGIILSGAGINPAYLICFFLIIFIYQISSIFLNFKNKEYVIERIKDFALVGLVIIGVNLFWILPTLQYIFGSITPGNSIDKLGYTNWVDSLSLNTSLINVIRMRGAWDWYSFDSVTNLPLYIPYAVKYFYNPFFVAFSFIIPTFGLLGLILRRKNYIYLYLPFGIMFVVGIFLTAGTHEPTGILFKFLSAHLPFFTLFRSPWYIFAPLVGISIAGFVSLFFCSFDIPLIKKAVNFLGIIFIGGLLVYSYPLLTGRIFRPSLPDNFYIKFPNYVFQTRDWLNSNPAIGRIISYPDDNIERFNWGYAAVDSILNLMTDKEIVFSSINDTNSPISQVTTEFYSGLKKSEIQKTKELALRLGVGQLFYKSDQPSLSPSLPQELMNNVAARFGSWSFYNILSSDELLPKVHAVDCCVLSYPYSDSAKNLALVNVNQILVNSSDSLLKKTSSIQNGAVIHAENSQEKDFLSLSSSYGVKSIFTLKDMSKVLYSFNVPEDGYYKPVLEKYKIVDFGIDDNKGITVSLDGNSQVWPFGRSDDSYIYYGPVYFKAGKHVATFSLKNNNSADMANLKSVGDGSLNFSNGGLEIINKTNNAAGISVPVANFDQTSVYLISFSYKYSYGEAPQVLLEQGGKTSAFRKEERNLPGSPDWQKINFYYKPVIANSELRVGLFASASGAAPFGTKVSFNSLVISKVFENDFFLVKDSGVSLNKSKVTFKKVSSTSYEGEIDNSSGPTVLVFDDNYSSDWELSIADLPSTNIFHFTANYYANGWYIENLEGKHKFNIYYKPQRLLNVGYLLSGLVVLSTVGYFIYCNRKKNV